MIRKSIFALVAVATLTATALVPNEAAAKGFKGKGFYGFALGTAFILGTAAVVHANCWRWVQTPSGYYVKVWVCN
jgi:hypothetical protein